VMLNVWADNDARLRANSELSGLSKNLSVLGRIGLQTLEYWRAGQAAPQGWIEQQIAALNAMEKPSAEVNLAAVRPVRLLVLGASQRRSNTRNK
jgi:hypothetical protein